MENDNNFRLKYSAKASYDPASNKYYCNTYDIKEKVSNCSQLTQGFKGKVQ